MNAIATVKPASGFGLLLNPESLKEAREFAEMLSKSDLVPKNFQNKPGDIMIAGAMGARLGLDIFASLGGIGVVNGKPTLYGDAMLAVCQVRPDFVDIVETITGEGDAVEASCTIHRANRSPYTSTFSFADAKKAQLWGKQGPWSAQPKRMCQMRARAFALRGQFADALAGFHAREEMEEELVEVQGTVRETVAEPKAGKRRAAPVATVEHEPHDEQPAAIEPKPPGAPVPVVVEPTKPDPAEKVVEAMPPAPVAPVAPAAPAAAQGATVDKVIKTANEFALAYGPRGVAQLKTIREMLGVPSITACPPELADRAMELLNAAITSFRASTPAAKG